MEKMTDYFPTAVIEVATNLDEFNKLKKKYNIKMEDDPTTGATTYSLIDECPIRFVVYVKDENTSESFYALLAHEAVHMAVDYMKYMIKEDNPSDEFLAYTTQAMMKALINGYNDKKSKKKE